MVVPLKHDCPYMCYYVKFGHSMSKTVGITTQNPINWIVLDPTPCNGGVLIVEIRPFPHVLPRQILSLYVQNIPTTASHSMDAWAPVTASEVEKMIGDAPNKTCNLDPAPTWLIKEFHRLLSPFVALLINVSFISGCLPAKYKHAVVSPLLKKSDAGKNELKNYRPVLNLPLIETARESRPDTVAAIFNCL